MTEKATAITPARAFLLRPQTLQASLFDIETRAYELQTLATKCTTLLSPVAGSGHDDRKLENLIAQIDELENRKKDLEEQKQQAIDALAPVLLLMPTPRYAVLLTEHYLELRSIAWIARHRGLSDRYVSRLLRKACDEYELIYNSHCA